MSARFAGHIRLAAIPQFAATIIIYRCTCIKGTNTIYQYTGGRSQNANIFLKPQTLHPRGVSPFSFPPSAVSLHPGGLPPAPSSSQALLCLPRLGAPLPAPSWSPSSLAGGCVTSNPTAACRSHQLAAAALRRLRFAYKIYNASSQGHLCVQTRACQPRSNEVSARLRHRGLLYNCSYHTFCNTETESSVSNYCDMLHGHSRESQCYFYQVPDTVCSGCFSVLENTSLKYPNQDWQELRKQKLTASTFGGAVGLWRGRRVQLWLEKLGVVEPFSGNSATYWEKLKVETALQQYILITGNDVQFLDFKLYNEENPNDDWLAASPDGISTNLSSEGVLEIKCPFFKGNMGKAIPWLQVPVRYMPQAQGLMEILDKDWLDLYCWTPRGSSLLRIPRDQQYWSLLKTALSDFWWKHVHPAREILSRTLLEENVEELKLLRPAPRHKLFNHIACASRHLVNRSNLLMAKIN